MSEDLTTEELTAMVAAYEMKLASWHAERKRATGDDTEPEIPSEIPDDWKPFFARFAAVVEKQLLAWHAEAQGRQRCSPVPFIPDDQPKERRATYDRYLQLQRLAFIARLIEKKKAAKSTKPYKFGDKVASSHGRRMGSTVKST
jgi:hypothetical protein